MKRPVVANSYSELPPPSKPEKPLRFFYAPSTGHGWRGFHVSSLDCCLRRSPHVGPFSGPFFFLFSVCLLTAQETDPLISGASSGSGWSGSLVGDWN